MLFYWGFHSCLGPAGLYALIKKVYVLSMSPLYKEDDKGFKNNDIEEGCLTCLLMALSPVDNYKPPPVTPLLSFCLQFVSYGIIF